MNLPCDPNSNCNATVIAYLDGFRAAMVTALAPVLSPSSTGGAFVLTCYTHVVEDDDHFYSVTKVAGQTMAQTVAAWYSESTTGPAHAAVDGPWLPRNPTC